jgi:RNA polymerase sporulation-specific sigma factor
MTDEELALKARQGDTKALNDLFGKYKNLVNKISRSYFLLGGEFEDIIQEGMIGLYKAIQNFSDNKNASFKTFASMCIKHQIISAIKVASSQKNMVLSSALPISEQNDEEDDSLEIILPSSLPQPDQTVFEKESIAELQEKIKKTLSALEIKVLSLYLKGFSYNEISEKANMSKKSIDNALTRIKSKLQFIKNS